MPFWRVISTCCSKLTRSESQLPPYLVSEPCYGINSSSSLLSIKILHSKPVTGVNCNKIYFGLMMRVDDCWDPGGDRHLAQSWIWGSGVQKSVLMRDLDFEIETSWFLGGCCFVLFFFCLFGLPFDYTLCSHVKSTFEL